MSDTREEVERLTLAGVPGREIARRLGVHHSTVQKHQGRSARQNAAKIAPLTVVVPDGFHLSGISSTVDAEGKIRSQSYKAKSGDEGDVVPESGMFPAPDGMFAKKVSTLIDGQTGAIKQQWVKADIIQEERFKLLIDAMKAALAESPRLPPVPRPIVSSDTLLTAYPMGDPHLGLYAWAAETGTDFDLAIAERNLTEAVRRLIAVAPASRHALIVNLGDFFHSDNQQNRTARSGHALDVDTRWAKVLRIGARAMRTCIELALEKHEFVHVIDEIGNHDDHTSQMLTLALGMFFENNPRVTFDESPAKFHYYKFGKTLIGVTHGDTCKPTDLGGVMAADRAEDWGTTKHRYWMTGHVHHQRVFELPGVLVESFRTLAGRDAWTAASGYRSGRDMQAIVFHEEWGEIERHRIDISALESVA